MERYREITTLENSIVVSYYCNNFKYLVKRLNNEKCNTSYKHSSISNSVHGIYCVGDNKIYKYELDIYFNKDYRV